MDLSCRATGTRHSFIALFDIILLLSWNFTLYAILLPYGLEILSSAYDFHLPRHELVACCLSCTTLLFFLLLLICVRIVTRWLEQHEVAHSSYYKPHVMALLALSFPRFGRRCLKVPLALRNWLRMSSCIVSSTRTAKIVSLVVHYFSSQFLLLFNI